MEILTFWGRESLRLQTLIFKNGDLFLEKMDIFFRALQTLNPAKIYNILYIGKSYIH